MTQKAHRTTAHTKHSTSTSSPSRKPSRDGLCQFPFSDGRTCRMPRSKKHRTLCVFHARSEHELLAADQAARRLISLSGEFKTASDINHVLGELFSLVAQNRIPRREAVTLAYIGQLLLQSLPDVRSEIKDTLGYRAWNATVYDALTPYDPESDENATESGEEPGEESAGESEASSSGGSGSDCDADSTDEKAQEASA